jgi:hypothetical protein
VGRDSAGYERNGTQAHLVEAPACLPLLPRSTSVDRRTVPIVIIVVVDSSFFPGSRLPKRAREMHGLYQSVYTFFSFYSW